MKNTLKTLIYYKTSEHLLSYKINLCSVKSIHNIILFEYYTFKQIYLTASQDIN